MQQQRFESTFFNLLRLYKERVERLKFSNEIGTRTFIPAQKKLTSLYNIKSGETIDNTKIDFKNFPEILDFWSNQPTMTYFTNVFRFFQAILKFIVNTPNVKFDTYCDIIIASMSEWELVVFYYLGLVSNNINLKELYEKLKFFYSIDTKILLDNDHIQLYDHMKSLLKSEM